MEEKQKAKSDFETWRVSLNDDCKKTLLRNLEIRDELILKDIFITDVALLLYLHLNDNQIEDRNNTIDEQHSLIKIKQVIGHLLRMLGGYAEQSGLVMPIFCIIEVGKDRKDIKEIVEQWAADQDWHRGDFSLFLSESYEKSIETIRRLLSSIATVWVDIKPLEPLTSNQYLAKLREELRVKQVSQEHASLLDAITAAWSDKKPIESAIMQWLDHRLQDVEGLLVKE